MEGRFTQAVFLFALGACLIVFGASACSHATALEEQAELELVFQSGFEGCFGYPEEAHRKVTGADPSFTEKNDWQADLEGHPAIYGFFIFYEGGDASQRYARLIPEPGNPTNTVLHGWLNEAYIPYGTGQLKGRIQATIDGTGLREVYFKQRIYLPSDMEVLIEAPATFRWLTVQEFWNNPPAEPYPFRISINIVKPNATTDGIYFRVNGQVKIPDQQEGWEDIWSTMDDTFPIPVGEWMTLETRFREGDAESGYFQVIVTDASGNSHEVADVHDFTHHPDDPSPDGLSNFNPMKLYTSERLINAMRDAGRTLQLYWDDIEFRLRTDP